MAQSYKYGEGAAYVYGSDGTDWVAESVDSTGKRKAIVFAEDPVGDAKKLKVDDEGILRVRTLEEGDIKPSNVSPFGDEIAATRWLMTHAGFNYPQSGAANINSDIFEVIEFSAGTPAAAPTANIVPERKLEIYSGQAGNATGSVPTTASLNTKRRGRYVPGFGLSTRFTALFSPPNAFTTQLIGMGSDEDAITVGFPASILTNQGNPNPLEFSVGRTSFVTGVQVGTYVTQSNFNVDKLDGTGPSKMILDPTKGNVFQIDYQWLGFGGIFYYIEDPITARYFLFHRTSYANEFDVPSTSNPGGFSLFAYALHEDYSATPVDGVTLSTSSMALYSEGEVPRYGPRRSFSNTKNSTGTVILAIRVSETFPVGGAYKNRQNISIIDIDVAKSGGNKTGVFEVVLNPTTLTGVSWSPFGANTSIAEIDTSTTALVNGTIIKTTLAATESSSELKFDDLFLVPGDVIAVRFSTTGTTSDATVAVNWIDLF